MHTRVLDDDDQIGYMDDIGTVPTTKRFGREPNLESSKHACMRLAYTETEMQKPRRPGYKTYDDELREGRCVRGR